MKKLRTTLLGVLAGLALSTASSNASFQYDFTSLLAMNSGIQFNSGSTFQFNPLLPPASPQFGGTANVSPTVYYGYVTSAPWTIGAITINGSEQTAMITTPGVLTIVTASGNLTGNLTWGTIRTSGTADNINIEGSINVTGLSYSGVDPNFVGIPDKGIFTVSSANNDSLTLSQLVAGMQTSPATFAGSLTAAIPEPSAALAGVLMLLPFGASMLRVLRRNRQA